MKWELETWVINHAVVPRSQTTYLLEPHTKQTLTADGPALSNELTS